MSTNLVTGGADQKASAIFERCAVEGAKAVFSGCKRTYVRSKFLKTLLKERLWKIFYEVCILQSRSRCRGFSIYAVRLAGALGAVCLANSMMKQRIGGSISMFQVQSSYRSWCSAYYLCSVGCM